MSPVTPSLSTATDHGSSRKGAGCYKSLLGYSPRTKHRKITKRRIPQGQGGGGSQHVQDMHTLSPLLLGSKEPREAS